MEVLSHKFMAYVKDVHGKFNVKIYKLTDVYGKIGVKILDVLVYWC